MRKKEIVNAAKEHGKQSEFSDLAKSPLSKGVFSSYGVGFIDGAVWADNTMIDKACEWLEDMACYYAHWEYNVDTYEKEVVYDTEKLIEDFKKTMEGGEE